MRQPKGDRDRGLIPHELAREIMAGKVIDGNTGEVIDYVDALLDIEYSKNPSTLIKIPLSEREHGDIAYYDTLSENMAKGKPGRNTPLGKLIV